MGKKVFIFIILPVMLACIVYGAFWVYGEIRQIPKEYSAEDIYAMAMPSVVEINGESYGGGNTGTGFFYDDAGTVITNYHVIEGCTSATIKTNSGEIHEVVSVLGFDAERDIAILDTRCNSSVPLKFRTEDIKTGEIVYSIGSSLGLTGSLSDGIVSTAMRVVDGHTYIQTTTPISSGNSGGPLIDKYGNVIGITTASFVDGQNLNLAIPIYQIEYIFTGHPVTLSQLFQREVEWLYDGDFFYYGDEDKYVLVFQIGDKDKVPITMSGTAKIVIANNNGETVYRDTREFDKSSYASWIFGGDTEKTLITIYIDPDDITPSDSPYGMVRYLVFGDEYSFETLSLSTYELPTK